MPARIERQYNHVLAFALDHPWALTATMRAIVAGILAMRIAGAEDADPATMAALVNRKNLPQPTRGGVAVIPFYGVVAPRMNLFSEMSGGTTFDALTSQLQQAVANDAIKTIVFDCDSPGGNVAGATEFAAEVLKARAVKPIIAQAQHLMASAAFWPLACATQIVASPSAMVGSLGVFMLHNDISEALAQMGIKRSVISAGKFKAEGADGGPLTPEALAHIQALVDDTYGRMVADVATGRGVKPSAIRGGYGEGRLITAVQALDLGMIDRIATLDETIARVSPTSTTRPAAPAALKPERFMGDPDGQRDARTPPSAIATDQEPSPATSQERATDAQWQIAAQGALLNLDL